MVSDREARLREMTSDDVDEAATQAVALGARRPLSHMISVRLENDLVASLRSIAESTGESISSVIRDAVTQYTLNYETARLGDMQWQINPEGFTFWSSDGTGDPSSSAESPRTITVQSNLAVL